MKPPKRGGQDCPPRESSLHKNVFRAAAFRGRRERSLWLFLVAWEGHQADKKAK